jgi:hypothetical protein
MNLELLQVYRFDKKIRCGVNADGGYVFAELDGNYDCYISAGISDEESFSRDFIERYTIPKERSYGFDGTIEQYPTQYTENIQFFKKNIGNCNDESTTDLTFLTEKYSSIFLKIDIEGGEYPWLLHLDNSHLSKFKQIVIEFHGIMGDSWNYFLEDKVKCLEKLAKTHYIIHAHGNNHGFVVNGIPEVIELTYVRKDYLLVPEKNLQPLPVVDLDFPNSLAIDDIDLNIYPFVGPKNISHEKEVI